MAASSNRGEGGSAPPNPSNNSNNKNKNDTNGNNTNNNNGGSHNNNNKSANISLQLKHSTDLATEWSAQEQAILEEHLSKFSGDPNILKYVKIATLLPEKTVRDVALRCRWMSKKESGKRRKAEDQNPSKKMKDKKEKSLDPSKSSVPIAARSNVPMYSQPLLPMDNDDGISYDAIGGKTGQLLQQNAHVFSKIAANLQAYQQIQENIELFCRTRSNIAAILNEMNDMPGAMSQMPPIPIKMNDHLADSILPKLTQVSTPSSS